MTDDIYLPKIKMQPEDSQCLVTLFCGNCHSTAHSSHVCGDTGINRLPDCQSTESTACTALHSMQNLAIVRLTGVRTSPTASVRNRFFCACVSSCTYAYAPCACSVDGSQQRVQIPGTGVRADRESLCRCWELNPGHLKSNNCSSLLTYLPSPYTIHFIIILVYHAHTTTTTTTPL